jgi:hypothetical protein
MRRGCTVPIVTQNGLGRRCGPAVVKKSRAQAKTPAALFAIPPLWRCLERCRH